MQPEYAGINSATHRLVQTSRRAAQLYRVADRLHRRGHPSLAWLVATLNRILSGVEIEPGARIGPGLTIKHGLGTVIGFGVVMGRDCKVMHGVSIGLRESSKAEVDAGNWPVVGDRVTIYAGAVIAGPVTVGDDAVIGANAVVTRDVPAGATVVAPKPDVR
jgi:serine O-acetyltransferase